VTARGGRERPLATLGRQPAAHNGRSARPQGRASLLSPQRRPCARRICDSRGDFVASPPALAGRSLARKFYDAQLTGRTFG
jgi:hypothetical protein